MRGVHAEEDALRLRVEDGRALTLQIRQIDEPARASRSGRRGRIERAGRGNVEQIHGPGDGASGALLGAEDIAAVAVERVDVEHAVLRVDERRVHLAGDPGRGAEAEIEIARLCHARADIGAGAVSAADGHGNACAQAETACRLLGKAARDLAAGADLREFVEVDAHVMEHFRVILPRLQVHEQTVGRVGHVGRFHLAREAVDKVILGLQNAVCTGVALGLVLLQPERLAERRRGREHIAADLVEIIPAESGAQRVGDGQGAGIGVDHGGAECLPFPIHGQAAEHMAGNADGIDTLDILGHKLPQHHHRAHGAHPPVSGFLLAAAVRVVVRGIGRGDVADNIQIFIDQRSLQAAGPDIEGQ